MMRPPMLPHRSSPTLVLVLSILMALVAACSSDVEAGPPGNPGKGVYVPLVWKTARTVNNHRVHVAREHVACSRCHEIGRDSMGPVTPDRCADCHEKEAHFDHAKDRAQARFGPQARTDCTTCHAFTVHESVEPSPSMLPPGHPDAGTAAVNLDAGPGPGTSPHVPEPSDCQRCHATQQDDTPAVQVHGTSKCATCHRPHQDVKGSIGPCPECHQKISTGHAIEGKELAQACTTCHSHPHAPASEALSACATCHAKTEPKVPATALFAEGHKECIGCHRPHDFTKETAAPCRSCHEDVHVLGVPRVAAHERCENCHTPHDVRAVGDAVCAKCHQTVHADHPKVAGESCTGCHDPHPASARTVNRPCSTCHQIAASEHGFHAGVACTKCHAPHQFGLTLTDHTPCAGCHQQQTTLTATLTGHGKCEGCHRGLPHRPDRLEAGCDTCHAALAATVRAGHSQCRSCHEPHGGSIVADCKTCHGKEQRTELPGHKACTECHDQHTGSVAQAPCGNCHRNEQASPHGKIADGCTSCHRPHEGVPPPACTTCHQADRLPGLHAVAKHQECKSCHTAHGQELVSARATCQSCHTDRKAHFPDAASCGGCHLFGPTR